MKDYNPNNGFGVQTVELTFQQWDYKLISQVHVRGNCKGFSVFESAICSLDNSLYNEYDGQPTITLMDEKGNKLEVDVESEEHLKEMLVEAKIIDFTKE